MTQGVCTGRPRAFKKWQDHVDSDLGDARWLPLGHVVFVNGQGANAFYGFAAYTPT
jgi:hypothetical protein